MALGNSAGRSSGNRNGEGARRRASDREREGIDPPLDQLQPLVPPKQPRLVLTARGHRVVDWACWTLWMMTCMGFTLLVFAWFGLIC